MCEVLIMYSFHLYSHCLLENKISKPELIHIPAGRLHAAIVLGSVGT